MVVRFSEIEDDCRNLASCLAFPVSRWMFTDKYSHSLKREAGDQVGGILVADIFTFVEDGIIRDLCECDMVDATGCGRGFEGLSRVLGGHRGL